MRPSLRVLWPCNGPLSLTGREGIARRNTERGPNARPGPFSLSRYTRTAHFPDTKTSRCRPVVAACAVFYFLGARIHGSLVNVTYSKDLGGLFCDVRPGLTIVSPSPFSFFFFHRFITNINRAASVNNKCRNNPMNSFRKNCNFLSNIQRTCILHLRRSVISVLKIPAVENSRICH